MTFTYETPDGAVMVRVKARDLREAEQRVKDTLKNTMLHRHLRRLNVVSMSEDRCGPVHMRSA